MKFSPNAPEILVKLYEYLTSTPDSAKSQNDIDDNPFNSQSLMLNYLNSKSIPHAQIEGSPLVFWMKKDLPNERLKKELEKLLVDDKYMPKVWKSIAKLSNATNINADYLFFWQSCQDGILEYENGSNLTVAEHNKQHQEIHDLASQLSEKMAQSDFFKKRSNFRPNDLIWEGGIKALLDYINSVIGIADKEKNFEAHFMFLLVHYMYSYNELLKNIADKASHLANEKLLVPRPYGDNAPAQHFTITLSKYFRAKYGKPSHDAVTYTVSAIFEHEFNVDWVKKIVANK